jgi:hypothetical protein
MMSLLTELEIILRKNFYKYVAPTALLPPAGGVFSTCPGIEMPGYFRWFLRNRTLLKN